MISLLVSRLFWFVWISFAIVLWSSVFIVAVSFGPFCHILFFLQLNIFHEQLCSWFIVTVYHHWELCKESHARLGRLSAFCWYACHNIHLFHVNKFASYHIWTFVSCAFMLWIFHWSSSQRSSGDWGGWWNFIQLTSWSQSHFYFVTWCHVLLREAIRRWYYDGFHEVSVTLQTGCGFQTITPPAEG